MKILTKNLIYIFFMAILLSLSLFVFIGCNCSSRPNEETPEESEQEEFVVDSFYAFYENHKLNNESQIELNYGEEIDFDGFKFYFDIVGGTNKLSLNNWQKYLTLTHTNYLGEKSQIELTDFSTQNTGTYEFVIDYYLSFKFVVKVLQQERDWNLVLNFWNDKTEYELDELNKTDYGVMIDDGYYQNYLLSAMTKTQYQRMNRTQGEIALDDVVASKLTKLNTNTFENLGIGSYYVCAYSPETNEFKSTYSNVLELNITQKSMFVENAPILVEYSFETEGVFDESLISKTISDIYDQNTSLFKVTMQDNTLQEISNGNTNGFDGYWKFDNNQTSLISQATDGESVLPENIISTETELTVGEKYVFMRFVPNNVEYKESNAVLVKIKTHKGKLITPQNFFVNVVSEDEDIKYFDNLTYTGEQKMLYYSWRRFEEDTYGQGFFETTVDESLDSTIEGKTTFTLNKKDFYEFEVSLQLSEKPDNYVVTNEDGVLTISWSLSKANVTPTFSPFEIDETEQKIYVDVEFDNLLNVSPLSLYDFAVDDDQTQILNTSFNNSKVTIEIEILSFEDDVRAFNLSITPKTAYSEKIELSGNEQEIVVKKYLPENKTENITQNNVSINTLNSMGLFDELKTYFNINYKLLGNFNVESDYINLGENMIDGERIKLVLTPKNDFFTQELDANKLFVLEYKNEQVNLKWEPVLEFLQANYGPYVITNTFTENSGDIKIDITFDSTLPEPLTDVFAVSVDGTFANLKNVSSDGQTLMVVVTISGFSENNDATFVLGLSVKDAYLDVYGIRNESSNHGVQKVVPADEFTIVFAGSIRVDMIGELMQYWANYNFEYRNEDDSIFDASVPLTESKTIKAVLTAKTNSFFYAGKTVILNFVMEELPEEQPEE